MLQDSFCMVLFAGDKVYHFLPKPSTQMRRKARAGWISACVRLMHIFCNNYRNVSSNLKFRIMEDNRNIQGGNERQQGVGESSTMNQPGQQQNTTSGQQQQQNDRIGEGANPQDGDQWNNYRSRELSDNKSGSDKGSNV